MRRVHAEGQRERENMRQQTTTHQAMPKTVDASGRMHWCCMTHRDEAIENGNREEWAEEHGYELVHEEGWVKVDE